MHKPNELPAYDDAGRNLVDPNDRRGLKTDYISLLQSKAWAAYVGTGESGLVLDLGCGYGRMSGVLQQLGWDTVGLDPSLRILKVADKLQPGLQWCCGGLPQLPFRARSFDLVMLQNLLRRLHIDGELGLVQGVSEMVKEGGRLVVVDNIREGHPNYVPERWILDTFSSEGLTLVRKVAIRRARWWGIYAIRYGLVPRSWHERLADVELRQMAKKQSNPRWQYYNVMYVFERAPQG